MTGAVIASSYGSSTPATSVQLSDQSIEDSSFGTATAVYNFNAAGSITDQTGAIRESWLLAGSASSFEVRATVTHGTVNGSAVSSWLNCGTNRQWYLLNDARDNSTVTAVIFVEIRQGSTVLVSATITLFAESEQIDRDLR